MKSKDTASFEWDVQDLPSHYVWEAASFIRQNPGAKGKEVEAHMEKTYPTDAISALRAVVGKWFMAEISDKALYERRCRIGGEKAGFYILAQGVQITDGPKPSFTHRKLRPIHGEWVASPPGVGTLLMVRGGGAAGHLIGSDGNPDDQKYCILSKGTVCLFLEVLSIGEPISSPHMLRIYGRPYVDGTVKVLADGKQIAMSASNLRFVVRKRGPGGKNVSL